jgi:hypothetical protein
MSKKAWHQQRKVKRKEFDGHVFDSGEELEFYRDYLKTGVYKADILSISLQPKYELLPKFEKSGTKHRAITYKPDFYIEFMNDRREVCKEVIEIKGFSTPDFVMRRKMFDYRYPDLNLIVLSKAPKKYGGGFILMDELDKLRKEAKKNGEAKKEKAEQATKRQSKGGTRRNV